MRPTRALSVGPADTGRAFTLINSAAEPGATAGEPRLVDSHESISAPIRSPCDVPRSDARGRIAAHRGVAAPPPAASRVPGRSARAHQWIIVELVRVGATAASLERESGRRRESLRDPT